MVRSSIADRYLKTLESNSLENAPKSPPKSIRSGSPVKSDSASPVRSRMAESPVKSPLRGNDMNARPLPKERTGYGASKSTMGSTLGSSPTKSSPTRSPARNTAADLASPSKDTITWDKARGPARSSPKSPTKSSPTRSPAKSPVHGASQLSPSRRGNTEAPKSELSYSPIRKNPSRTLPQSSVKLPGTMHSTASEAASPRHPNLGPKPDRNPLMHNQDLTPSQVSWDRERKNWQAYEYLCHVVEAKEWMEKIIGETLAPAEQFPESLQNGIAMAKVVQKLRPDLMKWPIFEHKRLQYRHTENITLFFDLLREMKIPPLFQFDMTDLYEKRNLPKVIYCLHAVSHFIAESEFSLAAVDNLVGKLQFSDDQLNTTEKGLAGHSMPNFGAMTRQLSGKHPKMDIPDEDEDEDTENVEANERRRKQDDIADTETDVSITNLSINDCLSDSEDDSSLLDVRPPRRYRRRQDFSDSSLSSIRRASRDLYNDRYSQYDRRQYRGYGYRNLSSTGSLRSRVLSTAELMLMELEELEPEITAFQGICRGKLARNTLQDLRAKHEKAEFVGKLQTLCRGKLARKDSKRLQMESEKFQSAIRIQALCRMKLARNSLDELRTERAKRQYTAKLQALCRGQLVRKHVQNLKQSRDLIQTATRLQSIARGILTRKFYRHKHIKLDNSQKESLIKLQSVSRALLIRRNFSDTANKANRVVHFQGLARGHLLRSRIAHQEIQLRSKESYRAIVALQSAFRGIVTRFRLGCLYDDLDQHIVGIVGLQARARGRLVRRQKVSTQQKWACNIDKIILLQSVWRARTQGARYRTLIADSNPSLHAIKPFLHLIDDKPEDYEREIELESIIKEIGRKVRENEQLESRIDQIDMKIALLVKNNISVDEVVLQHQRQNQNLRNQINQEKQLGQDFGFGKHMKRASASNPGLKDQFDPNSLQKASRDRVELYQGLFYVLQTQPSYFSRLMANKPPKSLDMTELVLATFGNAQAPREQFFLLRQLAHSITESTVGSAENTVAWSIVAHLNKRKSSTSVAKRILSPATEKLKACYDQLLEYDPHVIYENLTGGADLTAEEAIQDPAVRTLFVQNLQRLREITMAIVQSLAATMPELPYHIRFLAREVYREVLRVTNDRNSAMASIGQVIISQFIQPALLAADSLNLVDAAAGNTSKNLVLVSRVIHQVGLMCPFDASGSTDIYLQPLNEFVKSSAHHLSLQFQSSIIECDDPATNYNFSELDDITMHERPELTISMNHIMALHYMCFHHVASVTSENDAMLKPIVEQLGPLPKDAREMLDLGRFEEIKLELNPRYGSSTLSESTVGSSSLLVTTKRCLGYVLRVQSNQPDLMSVLVAPVELEDEHQFNILLDTDNTREVAGELGNLSFRELKLLTLEKVLELESSGKVSRKDGYQTLLNTIAGDIRNKDTLRQRKIKEIESKRGTLRGLEEKASFLQQRLDTYNQHVEEALTALQTQAHQANIAKGKRGFQRFQLPTSKTSFGHNSDKQGPKFGQYKTTADKLYERGILIRLRGYEDRQRKDVQFVFSCYRVGVFQIDLSYKGILLPNGSISISLDDLLAQQYQNRSHLDLMGNELQFSTTRLLQLIFHKFFGTSV